MKKPTTKAELQPFSDSRLTLVVFICQSKCAAYFRFLLCNCLPIFLFNASIHLASNMTLRVASLLRSMALPAGSAGVASLAYSSMLERGSSQTASKFMHRSLMQSSSRFRLLSTESSGTTGTVPLNSAQTAGKSRKSFLQWYEGHLESRPVVTKMVTGAFLWGIGDGVAQAVPRLSPSTKIEELEPYDWIRTGRAVIFGFAIHAPLAHFHYNFLEVS